MSSLTAKSSGDDFSNHHFIACSPFSEANRIEIINNLRFLLDVNVNLGETDELR